MSRQGKSSSFKKVLRREFNHFTERPLYLFTLLVLPLFVAFFMATIFHNGMMDDIPVGVVDEDFSATSRSIVRMLDASPTVSVTNHYTDAQAARDAVQRKEIYGYVVIPMDFEKNVLANQETILNYYYHYALLSVGSEVEGAFETILRTAASAPLVQTASGMGVSTANIMAMLQPTVLQSHPIYNPDLDYSIYLSQPFFFIIFQILILLSTIYAVGSEMKFGTGKDWLNDADGNIYIAVVAKLIPYSLIFILVSIMANCIYFGILHIPYSNAFIAINIVSILFVLASQGFALFIFEVFPAMSIMISIGSMFGSLGATLSGVTFPLRSMFPFFYYASYILPIRYYIEAIQDMLYSDAPLGYEWIEMLALCAFVALPFLLMKRLRKLIISKKYDSIE